MKTVMTLRSLVRRAAFWGIVGLLPVALAANCPELTPSDPNSTDICSQASPSGTFHAEFWASSANASASAFEGDFSTQPSGSNTMIISHATAGGVERKFIIIVPSLAPATYDLSGTYMSYTEKVGENANVWKATGGELWITFCSNGDLYIFTRGASMSAFATGGTNAATGGFNVGIEYVAL